MPDPQDRAGSPGSAWRIAYFVTAGSVWSILFAISLVTVLFVGAGALSEGIRSENAFVVLFWGGLGVAGVYVTGRAFRLGLWAWFPTGAKVLAYVAVGGVAALGLPHLNLEQYLGDLPHILAVLALLFAIPPLTATGAEAVATKWRNWIWKDTSVE
jgi:hypothetical protein